MRNGGLGGVLKSEQKIVAVILAAVVSVMMCYTDAQAKSNPGTTSANFLKIGTQAQAVGLGEAVTALADGISFAGYNPAAVNLKNLTLSATHTALYEGVNLEDVALGIPFGKTAGMFIRGSGVLFEKTERTDVSGNKTGDYGASSFAAGAGFYGHIGSLSLGVFGKSIQQKIDMYKASTVAADVGMRWNTPLPGLALGLAVLNIGRPVKFIAQEDDLPQAVRAGLGYDNGFLKVAVDGIQYSDQAAFVAAGAEITLFGGLRFRGGYSGNSKLQSPIKAGVGFRFSSLEINYAFNPGDEFGAAHRVSLTIR